jgi:pimeloyl-ACP methyl ester carboxylesterase
LQEQFTKTDSHSQEAELLAEAENEPEAQGIVREGRMGIATDRVRYSIPVCDRALVSFLAPGATVFRYASDKGAEGEPWRQIDVPALVYLGEDDSLLLGRQSRARETLHGLFATVSYIEASGGDHHFTGLEQAVAREIAEWICAVEDEQ